MIGVTLANKNFLSLAQEAGERFNQYTGLPYIIVRVNGDKPHLNKLRLSEYLPDGQTGFYFDSDAFFVREVDLSHLNEKNEFLAVKDIIENNTEACIFVKDCRLHGINRSIFFNSGVFVWNKNHRNAMKEAFNLSQTLKVNDWGEQSVLNLAMQRSEHDISFLPASYNSMVFREEKNKDLDSIVIHAAGIGGHKEKLQWLRKQSRKYRKKYE